MSIASVRLPKVFLVLLFSWQSVLEGIDIEFDYRPPTPEPLYKFPTLGGLITCYVGRKKADNL